ncbi:MAG: 6-bladed beta-propeller [Nitrospira sp.]
MLRDLFRYAIVGMTLFSLSACAAAPVKVEAPLFWPDPPDPPKIKYLKSLSEPKDIGVNQSWFKRVLRFIFGKGRTSYIIRPSGIAVDDHGGVYIADTGLQVVHHFDQTENKYRQFFRISPRLRLQNPIGVALDGSNHVYVSDADLNRVFVFDPKGKLARVIGNDEEIKRISGIAIDRMQERLYVVDTMGHRLLVYSLSGEKTGVIGKRGIQDGEFNFPTYATVDSEGRLYVSDSLNFRVQVFDRDGNYQSQMGSLGNRLGQFSRPKGVAVDQEQNIYVVDSLFDTIQIFNPSGELLLHFGKTGVERGTFWLPAGIAVDPQGRIYVADTYNKRVQIFQLLREEEIPAG